MNIKQHFNNQVNFFKTNICVEMGVGTGEKIKKKIVTVNYKVYNAYEYYLMKKKKIIYLSWKNFLS